MTKTETTEKLKKLAGKMRKTYLEYVDSLEDDGNEIGKEEGYLEVAIWRDSIHITTTVDSAELKEEHQISIFLDKEESNEVADNKEGE